MVYNLTFMCWLFLPDRSVPSACVHICGHLSQLQRHVSAQPRLQIPALEPEQQEVHIVAETELSMC